MEKDRVQAFSDGVIAILITIMVLELKITGGSTARALGGQWRVFVCYVLSFVYLGIYWNNHHHLLAATRRITGGVLWANMNLLFWLSLFPSFTQWMGENHFDPLPTACYGIVLLAAALSYYVLVRVIIRAQGPGSDLEAAVGEDRKGKISPVIYALAIPIAFVNHWVSLGMYCVVAVIWLIPDRRIESRLNAEPPTQ
jgi:uncharacterized membrane protein